MVETQKTVASAGNPPDTNERIKRYVVEAQDGRDLFISYDPQTTLTVIHDYAPGRNLIFKGNELDASHTLEIPARFDNLNLAILVENTELSMSSPLELWNKMRAKQTI